MEILMDVNKPDNQYSIFRHDNINLISEISRTLETEIDSIMHKLNSLNSNINSMHNGLDSLNRIYFSFHSMAGTEALIRLKILIQRFKSDSEKNRSRIAAAHFLIKKIQDFIDNKEYKNFEPFRTEIGYIQETIADQLQSESLKPEMKFKWITFSRNNSWFITGFKNLEIIEVKQKLDENVIDNRISLETLNREKIEAIDLMRRNSFSPTPKFGIRLSSDGEFYAADIKGKEIYSMTDFITPMISIIEKKRSPLYTGRVRLFGKNHLLLFQK